MGAQSQGSLKTNQVSFSKAKTINTTAIHKTTAHTQKQTAHSSPAFASARLASKP
ncbi:hypothetical protein [Kingella sp. (in: b-proteobacteria)]|uniref:hypothetical protein n=1 Tax=Kingella sp. (in: b-proteobacteria) TaxID=2020713 RepID=UPI0026DCD6BC|nr:hypothetical protein [Kingella sp. (in: b-proteobacteria)]MDO4656394.1 hypothetical protein [Kingella sp. (in: b-proteobacteria)]